MGIRTTSRQHEIHVASAERVRPLRSAAAAEAPLLEKEENRKRVKRHHRENQGWSVPGHPRSRTSIQSMTRGVTAEGLQMRNVGPPPQPPRYGINQLSSNWGEKTKNPVGTCPPISKFGCPFIHGRTDRMGLTKDKIPHLEGVSNTSLIKFSPPPFSFKKIYRHA
ncbi:hypothetical protein J6590_089708 [Homalodisca vitripennis]|nr:hypothetical protein J6590_089708 [Homalodisca vitripennis]